VIGAVVEQHVQRIEDGAAGVVMRRIVKRRGCMGEVAVSPIALRADAREPDCDQPAAIAVDTSLIRLAMPVARK
jgi:dihydroxyacetone kinase